MKISPNFSVIKQLISHKKILVNDYVVNIRNFYVKPGDIVSVQPDAAIALQKSVFQKKFPNSGQESSGISDLSVASSGINSAQLSTNYFSTKINGNVG